MSLSQLFSLRVTAALVYEDVNIKSWDVLPTEMICSGSSGFTASSLPSVDAES
ncbi:hypothetical protein FocTR4_00006277 [Fusarium oxysporum f. sp. cubense]|uniref:Uncharacterized protein n=1 Tax=Fusarium oxysporum f. sp. cubense TaxID=61366 RepID=A0A5C6TPK3_FUSOC|nr:hypothetical protein FocTR4_00006277 [Fusarium oxysporum f. sp. cubense]